ncbi:MAG TPA: glycosyl hydrolase 115 family protein [Bryobacteraceae bacterium]|nr:glycosyl hydrolase 115 family protein [Bryobacteraceae bacterium]
MLRTTTLLLLLASYHLAQAQTAPWSAVLRGSWVQTASPAAGDIVLAAKDHVAEIVVGDDENSNVQAAAAFLAGDIEKISGYRPAIGKTPSGDRVEIRLVTLGRGDIPSSVGAASLQGQWESYRIVTAGRTVWLVGSNPRGTAFAAYALSERLGIDPLYIWSGYQPEHHDPLVMKRTSFSQGPPAFKYRGFFHDDEDLLPRPFDANGYPLQTGDVPLDWYKRFFETALRLRMNMVAPYTRVHRRYEVQKLASDWGLYYTSHHYDILLSNPWGLERFNLAAERGVRPEYNWFTNRDGMLKFWRAGVVENRDLDAIWPVGMRGTQDRPFVFPPEMTDEDKARTFREVIQAEVKMTKELLPKDKEPLFHFTMYSEMLPQYQRNPAAFDLPSDVIIVWPDDNDGHMRGLPAELGRWKHGVYYHLAYLGGRLTKQLTHTVGPSVVAEQFDKIVKSGATEYMLVNVSEVRDYVMGTRMLADITWDAPAIYAAPDAAGRYTKWWTREYFNGSKDATDAYDKYFGLLNAPNTLWEAPNAIEELLDRLYHKVAGQSYAPLPPEMMPLMQTRERQLTDALATELRAERPMSMSQQRFLSVDVALGLQVAERQTRAALKLDEALRAPDAARMWQAAREAQASLEQLEAVLELAEYPPFDRWYQESWIRTTLSESNPHRPYIQLRAFIANEGRGSLARAPRRP